MSNVRSTSMVLTHYAFFLRESRFFARISTFLLSSRNTNGTLVQYPGQACP